MFLEPLPPAPPLPAIQRPRCCMPAAQISPTPPPASPEDVPQVPTPGVRAEHSSLPFIEDMRVINKTTQNLHAELALRLLAKLPGTETSRAGGARALKPHLL